MMPCLRKSHEKQPELLKKAKRRRCQSISTRSEILRMDILVTKKLNWRTERHLGKVQFLDVTTADTVYNIQISFFPLFDTWHMVENWFFKNPCDVGVGAQVDISTSEVSQNTLERSSEAKAGSSEAKAGSSEAKADWWFGKMPLTSRWFPLIPTCFDVGDIKKKCYKTRGATARDWLHGVRGTTNWQHFS